jgi:hypothetical protein
MSLVHCAVHKRGVPMHKNPTDRITDDALRRMFGRGECCSNDKTLRIVVQGAALRTSGSSPGKRANRTRE